MQPIVEAEKNTVVYSAPGVTRPKVLDYLVEHDHLVKEVVTGYSSDVGAETLTVFMTDGGSREATTELVNLALRHYAND